MEKKTERKKKKKPKDSNKSDKCVESSERETEFRIGDSGGNCQQAESVASV